MREEIFLQEKHRNALLIKRRCGHHWNLGAICYKHSTLDLQNMKCRAGRDLVGELAAAGCAFTRFSGYRPVIKGETCCWGGSASEGGLPFDSIDLAVKFLKIHFKVSARDENVVYTKAWIARL